ncbi:hypothetical protein CIG75_14355 [Tumebacillus algifaecis]|uniref:Uncharacterized protein n=1 Tax=Tumebacillus algifaecis TaxID=1214604 RepID=A0A223D2Y6_9BACL|nr:hypothetical protein [Tumebacillus algifaecis]ASS76028.1 hypothetical protein CIG75_14355 [Tumebacillus algifaecis]
MLKRISMVAVAVGVLALTANTTFAAPTLCYYSFNSPWGAGSLTSPITSPKFKVTNSNAVVTIKGWQDTPFAGTPNVYYDLMRVETFIDTQVGRTNIRGIYPKNGTWYSYTFSGANTTKDYYIKMSPNSSTGMDGAGNAYDGY